MTTLTEKIT